MYKVLDVLTFANRCILCSSPCQSSSVDWGICVWCTRRSCSIYWTSIHKKKHNRGALWGKDCRREQTLKFPYRLTAWLRAPQTERQEAGGAAELSAQYMLLWSRSPGGFKVSCHVLNSQHDTTQQSAPEAWLSSGWARSITLDPEGNLHSQVNHQVSCHFWPKLH